MHARPALRPRWECDTRPFRCCTVAGSSCTDTAPTRLLLSGLHHTAHVLAVYASQRGLPLHHARLASGRWPGVTGRGWSPAGSRLKVSVTSSCVLLHQVAQRTQDDAGGCARILGPKAHLPSERTRRSGNGAGLIAALCRPRMQLQSEPGQAARAVDNQRGEHREHTLAVRAHDARATLCGSGRASPSLIGGVTR